MTATAEQSTALGEPGSEPIAHGELRFLDQVWLRSDEDGTAEMGILLPGREVDPTRPIELSKVGTRVFEGLPLGSYFSNSGCHCLLPCPITGRVLARNPLQTSRLFEGKSRQTPLLWIARISPSTPASAPCRRDVVLVNSGCERCTFLNRRLLGLGCRVWSAPSLDEGLEQARRLADGVCVVTSDSLAPEHEQTIRNLNRQKAPARLMIVEPEPTKLVLFRSCGISSFLEDVNDQDRMVFELDRLFSPSRRTIAPATEAQLEPWRYRVRTTDFSGQETTFIVAHRLLDQFPGLGRQLAKVLAARRLPVIISPDKHRASQELRAEAEISGSRVVAVRAGSGRAIPGTIVSINPLQPARKPAREDTPDVEIVVQPAPDGGLPLVFDFDTTQAMAQRVIELGLGPTTTRTPLEEVKCYTN